LEGSKARFGLRRWRIIFSKDGAMARQPRLDLPGVPQHVIQRCNNRQTCFLQEQDYRFYLESLREASTQTGCHVHAYVLMTNHVHLLVTPKGTGAISHVM
jgi:putative transposase